MGVKKKDNGIQNKLERVGGSHRFVRACGEGGGEERKKGAVDGNRFSRSLFAGQ